MLQKMIVCVERTVAHLKCIVKLIMVLLCEEPERVSPTVVVCPVLKLKAKIDKWCIRQIECKKGIWAPSILLPTYDDSIPFRLQFMSLLKPPTVVYLENT